MKGREIGLILLVVGCSLASAGCLRSTQGTEIGIKVQRFFGADEIVRPGQTVIVIPLFHDWYVYDQRLQVLDMSRTGEGRGASDDALDFKTRDGNDIHVDVTIQWRIDPDKAPQLLRRVGPDMPFISRVIVRPLARSVPRDILNELTSEEFYDSRKRAEKAEIAQQKLDEALRFYGIICERVILQNYRFDPDYQKAIDDKKVADQEVNKNRSAAEAAVQEWERELEKTRGAVAQDIAAAEGRARQKKLEADAYFEAKRLEAQAVTTEMQAKAEGVLKQRQALSGPGGRTMVKLAIADKLKGKRIVLVPTGDANGLSLQRTDINALLDTLGVEAVAGGAGRASKASKTTPSAGPKATADQRGGS